MGVVSIQLVHDLGLSGTTEVELHNFLKKEGAGSLSLVWRSDCCSHSPQGRRTECPLSTLLSFVSVP